MKKWWKTLSLALLGSLPASLALAAEEGAAAAAEAAEAVKLDTGDTVFVLLSAALVMLMTPALALFYGGMTRSKNVLNTIMLSFFVLALFSVQWVLFGYSLAFGPDINHLLGSLDWAGLSGVGQEANADYAATVPHLAFMIFQCMFAVITPALITGSIAERMRFPAFALFVLFWTTVVYDPFAHWVWGVGGWLRDLGALDFAGGTVIHILSGVSGLVACLVMGKRRGYGVSPMMPHHLPMTVLGAALLWFGWFGFNAGSALGASGLAASAFVVTNTAAAAGSLGWLFVEWMHNGKPTVLGIVSGCIAGLVGITPAAGFVEIVPAVIIGLGAGMLCYFAVSICKRRLGYDDSLDAFGVHGVGGTWGALATGLFCTKEVNPAGADGFFYGGGLEQFWIQAASVGMAILFAAVMTFVILKVIALFTELRVSEDAEVVGLDISEHGENGYVSQEFGSGVPMGAGAMAFERLEQPVATKAHFS